MHTECLKNTDSSQEKPLNNNWVVLGALLLIAVTLISWQALAWINEQTKRDLEDSLQTILNATHTSIDLWANEMEHDARALAQRPDIILHIKTLLSVDREKDALRDSSAQKRLRGLIGPYLDIHGHKGFFVISPDKFNLGSMRDENLGWSNLLVEYGDHLDNILKGKPRLVLPLRSDVPLPGRSGDLEGGEPTMFIGVPVYDDGKVIAAFTIRMDPTQEFTRIAQIAWPGESGDTYAFNRSGRLISESRFDAQLRELGIIKESERGILSVTLRDPGGNMLKGFRPTAERWDLPLTKMAEDAISGRDGINVDGYRDYRGVPVVGAWLWNDKYNFGLAYEMDVTEAYRTYFAIRNIVISALCVIIGLFLAIYLLIIRNNRRLHSEIIERKQAEECLANALEDVKKIQHVTEVLEESKADLEVTLTEETRVRSELAAERERLFSILDSFPGFVYLQERDYKIRFANRRFIEEYGEPGDRLCHKVMWDRDEPCEECQTFRVFDTKEPLVWESNHLSTGRFYEVYDYPFVDSDGTFLVLEMSFDITERKSAEEALRTSEERLRSLTNATFEGIAFIREGLIVDCNRQLAEILGYQHYELLGIEGTKLVHSGDRELVRDRMVSQDEEPYEFRMLCKDGSIKFVEAHAQMMSIKDERLRVTAVRDITDRKQAEDTLRESEERYRHLFNSGEDSVFVHCLTEDGQPGKFIEVNDVACERYGYTREELLDMTIFDINDFDDAGLDIPTFLLEFFIKRHALVESLHVAKDGRRIPVEVNAHLFDFKGKPTILSIIRDITDRKRAEEEIEASQKMLWTVLDTIPVYVYWKDLNLRYLGCNALFAKGTGFDSPNEVVGKVDYQMSWSDMADDFRRTDLEVMEAGEARINFEETYCDADGISSTIRKSKIPLRDRNGKIFGVLGIDEDITERKRAEEALKESGKRYKEAQRIAGLGHWSLDLIKNELKWSEEVYRIFDVDPEEFRFTYEAFINLVHPDDRKIIDKAYTDSLRKKTPYDITHRLLMKDGTIKYVHERCETIFDANGKPSASIGTVQNITEQVHAEEALRESRERLLTAQRIARMGFIDWNIKTNEVYWSDETYALYGIDSEKQKADLDLMIGLVHPDDRDYVKENIYMALKGKKDYDIVYRNIHPDGKVIWLHAQAELVRDDKGEPESFLGSVVDITELKEAEEERKKSELEYHSLFENMLDGFSYCKMIYDEDGKAVDFVYLEVNDSFAHLTGLEVEEVLGKRVTEVIPTIKEENPELFDIYGGVASTGKETRFVIHVKPLHIWLDISVYCPRKGYFVAVFDNITDRMYAEEELRESEERYRSLFENESDAVLIFDAETLRFEDANRAAQTLFGYSKEKFLGFTPLDISAEKEKTADAVNGVIAEESGSDYIPLRYFQKKDGTVFPGEVCAGSFIFGGRKKIIGAVRDITERKHAEEAFAWDASVNAVLAEISGAILSGETMSIQGISELLLKKAQELTHSRFGFVGYIDQKTGHMFCPAISREAWAKCEMEDKTKGFDRFGGLFGWVIDNRKALLVNEPKEDPRSVGVPKGHVPIEKFLSVPALAGERLLGQIALANPDRDYTERDLAFVQRLADLYAMAVERMLVREGLQDQLRFLETLMDTIPSPIFYKDIDGKYIGCNRAFEISSGFTKEELAAKTVYDVAPKELSEEYYEKDVALFKNPGVQLYESSNRYADGTLHEVIVNKATYTRADGTLAGLVGVLTDITKRKKAENDLEDLNKALRRLVAEMTSLEERERKSFSETLHEGIGQHLVAIKLAIGGCLQTCDDETKELLEEISTMVDDSIKVTRSMTAQLYPSFLDDRHFNEALMWYAKRVMGATGIELFFDIDAETNCLTDEEKKTAFRIIRECFQNTTKYARASRFDVRCKVDESSLILTIKDDGRGFNYDKISENIERGLGLVLMGEWARSVDGHLKIRSQPGNGTEVIFEMPFKGSDIDTSITD